MASFTVRIVLHDNPQFTDYQTLYGLLGVAGFTDLIRADDGVWWRMPPGEYDFVGNLTMEQVRQLAATASSMVKPRYQVFVTETTRRCWVGLERVNPQPGTRR